MIPFSHVRNFALYHTALDRALRVESLGKGRYRVSSHRDPSEWHDVYVCGDGYACDCQERFVQQKACTHGAAASAMARPSLVALWRLEAECDEVERQCEDDLKFIQKLRERRHKAECESFWKPLRPMLKARAAEMAEIRRLDKLAEEILGTEKIAA